MHITKFLSFLLIISFSILFAGCRLVRWAKDTFNQGTKIDECIAEVPLKYIRTIRVYDQFTTLGIFNAMLLTPEVIQAFVDFRSDKFSYSDKESQELFNNEFQKKIGKFISFYVL